uniref:HTH CENPB-type domain-containing protein n=1 Tax=Peronospora matthiolae TaxID=2874970 RepID=A0AAV1TBV6_9STRA
MITQPSPPLTQRSRRNLTYREKLAIIHKKEEEPAWTQRNLALWAKEVFRLESKPTQATISNLLRAKDKLLNTAVPPEFRSSRRVKYPELDRRMLLWVHQELLNGVAVTRLSIQTKAIDLAHEMELPSDLTFSKGWVCSFTKRHQLDFATKGGNSLVQLDAARQDLLASTASEAVNRVEVHNVQQLLGQETASEGKEAGDEEEDVKDEAEAGYEERNLSAEMENKKEEEVIDDKEQVAGDMHTALNASQTKLMMTESSMLQPSVKRRKTEIKIENSIHEKETSETEERQATAEMLLLDWILMPGSYSRWWLLKHDEEKTPLCDEINVFLRAHGQRGMSSADIRLQITTLVTTFQAAQTWLHHAKVEYPLTNAKPTLEQERIKRHVLQMCPYYEKLVSILAAYVNCDNRTNGEVQVEEASPTTISSSALLNNGDAATQAMSTAAVVLDASPEPAMRSQRQGTEFSVDAVDDEAKAQKRHLFELECARLQSEIETKNVQLVLEKTLARKKLLDAGIPADEVNRIFPS